MKISAKLERRVLIKIQEIAKKIESVLAGRSLEEATPELRTLLDRLLEEDEYIVLATREGLGVLHTNRLREGNLFNDPVGLRAAQTTEPLVQIYPRNTGELLVDASAPVRINGKPVYSVRLGVVVPSLSFGWKLLSATLLPTAIAVIGVWTSDSAAARAIFTVMSVSLAVLTGWLAFRTFLSNWKHWISVTKSISSGRLKARAQTERRDELGQMSFEINKMAIGMHDIIGQLRNASRSTQDISAKQLDMVRDLLAASQHLSASLQQISSGSTEQSQLVQETETILKQINDKIRQAGSDLQATSKLSQEAESSAQSGMEKTNHLQAQMQRIQHAGIMAESSMQELEKQAAGIEQMIRDIQEIAEQTNLLALNAAIEAARAGEEGRGFAVVADEVRKLASRSDEVASEVMQLAGNISQKSNEAANIVKKERQEVDQGLELVRELQSLIQILTEKSSTTASHSIRNAKVMAEVLQDVDYIEARIEKVREISHSFSSSAQEVAASGEMQHNATEQVADQANRLREISDKIHRIAERFEL